MLPKGKKAPKKQAASENRQYLLDLRDKVRQEIQE
jgi:hypothetical protein